MNMSPTSLIQHSNWIPWRVQAQAVLIVVSLVLGAFSAGSIHAGTGTEVMQGVGSGMSDVRRAVDGRTIDAAGNSRECRMVQSNALSSRDSARGIETRKNPKTVRNLLSACVSTPAHAESALSWLPHPPSHGPDVRRALLQVYRI